MVAWFGGARAAWAGLVVPVLLAGSAVSQEAAVPVSRIQGRGAASPLVGQTLVTRGVVTAVFPGLKGYALQDERGDGDPATSDGIFVYTGGGRAGVEPGERVELRGTVREYGVRDGAATLTELVRPEVLSRLGRGAVEPTPLRHEDLRSGELERYEGMLVQLARPLVVAGVDEYGRRGQLLLVPEGRRFSPTERHRPGTAEAVAAASQAERAVLVLDDGRTGGARRRGGEPAAAASVDPDRLPRVGDTVAGLVGVIDQGSAGSAGSDLPYRLHPLQAPVFSRPQPRPERPPEVGGSLRVAAVNLLNWFTTFGDGTTADGRRGQGCAPGGRPRDCRGAADAVAFERQRDKLVANLERLDADLLVLSEVQRDGGASLALLAESLNRRVGASRYEALPDPPEGAGSDAVQLGMLVRRGRLVPEGDAFADPSDAHQRPPLARRFRTQEGERFTVIGVHFKSRRCEPGARGEPDAGDGQGCFNLRRRRQAAALLDMVRRAVREADDPDVLVVGDFNAHSREDPLEDLRAGGLVHLTRDPGGQPTWSYVHQGWSATLDHAFATGALAARVSGVAHWHVNADESPLLEYSQEARTGATPGTPWRASDHDPLLVGLGLASRRAAPPGR